MELHFLVYRYGDKLGSLLILYSGIGEGELQGLVEAARGVSNVEVILRPYNLSTVSGHDSDSGTTASPIGTSDEMTISNAFEKAEEIKSSETKRKRKKSK